MVITNSIGMKLAYIPKGEFVMGFPASAGDEYDGNHAFLYVITEIERPFRMGVYEVTQPEWTEVMGTAPWKADHFVKEGDQFPATHVSWPDATEFCWRLTERERRAALLTPEESYRLPVEVEWEYACRARTIEQFHDAYDGSSLGEYGPWYEANAWNTGESHAHRVDEKRPNKWGLYGMHGNVWEWCAGWPYRSSEAVSSTTDAPGRFWESNRLRRDGSLYFMPGGDRWADRFRYAPVFRLHNVGFRVARSSDSSPPRRSAPYIEIERKDGQVLLIPSHASAWNGHRLHIELCSTP